MEIYSVNCMTSPA